MKKYIKKIWECIKKPYNWIKLEIQYRRTIKKLREKDPYIYD